MRQLPLFPPTLTLADGRIVGPLPADAPIVVSNGVGIDSVAMLIELHRLNIKPDAIVTALVGRDEYGNEHRRFYQYLPVLDQWLAEVGFPPITYVWYEMKRQAKHFPYSSLAGNCLANRTLPSISFRRHHSCSLKFKGEQIDRWVTEQYGNRPCYRLVGYDLDEEHRAARFAAQAPGTGPRSKDVYVHPLQLLAHSRADCEQIIAAAGLPSPGLSSCVFCASMRPEEVDELNRDELWLIVILEAHAQVNLRTIRGLWGHGERMTEYIVRRGLLPKPLVDEVWRKWAASERPAEMVEGVSADDVLFTEVRRLICLGQT